MNVFVPYLAALHQQDLLQQAELQRRINLAHLAEPSLPAWRRVLSGLFASAAMTLDPSVEVERAPAVPAGGGASALPAC